MNLFWTIATIIFLAIVLPVVASFVMAIFLEAANNEGFYDEEND